MTPKPTKRIRSCDDDFAALFLGTGQAHSVSGPEEVETPGIWLPDHRSGSRFGGWHRMSLTPTRTLGFRPPR